MYKFDREHQYKFTDFNQPMGFKLNPDNRWVIKANTIPWDQIEDKYAKLFPSKTGMPAKPLRMALGSLLIKEHLRCSDEELVEQLSESPYLQYFIGLPGFIEKAPFVPSLLVEFRKRLNDKVLAEINEMIIEYNKPDSDDDNTDDDGNSGTMILDATCAPQNISYPTDINLLNEARENLESIIDNVCSRSDKQKPRMYRNNARKDYLNYAKSRKHTSKKTHKAIKAQLQYVKRDLRYVDELLKVAKLMPRESKRIEVIRKLYEQQLYMFNNKVHSVQDRIVSISQPYIRPIVRGKVAAPVEFGAKLDLSIDESGLARIEKLSFDAYNEAEVLKSAAENYKARTGHYPERILADKIYRNRDNISYCSERGIHFMGPALGRLKKEQTEEVKKQEYIDNADRIEVERAFSLAKRRYGLGKIVTKLEETTEHAIALSILAMNIDRLVSVSLRQITILVISRFKILINRFGNVRKLTLLEN